MSREERIEPCCECGGDGGWEVVDGPDYTRGGARTHWQECRACDGGGEEVVQAEPVEADDLPLIWSDDPEMSAALAADEEKLWALGAYDEGIAKATGEQV